MLHLAELSTVDPVHTYVIAIAEKKVHLIGWGALVLRGTVVLHNLIAKGKQNLRLLC
jgi:hypothetical protein